MSPVTFYIFNFKIFTSVQETSTVQTLIFVSQGGTKCFIIAPEADPGFQKRGASRDNIEK